MQMLKDTSEALRFSLSITSISTDFTGYHVCLAQAEMATEAKMHDGGKLTWDAPTITEGIFKQNYNKT